MFAAFCPEHGCDVLLGLSRIRVVTNLDTGVLAVELECYDGQRLVVLTGSRVNGGRSTRGPA